MIKAVCVDFDDTLCMTEEACFYMENETLKRMGRSPMSRDIHIKTWGMSLNEAIALRSPGINVDEFRTVLEPTHAQYVTDGLVDAVPKENIEVLARLKQNGVHVSVLTSRIFDELKHIIDAHEHELHDVISTYYYFETTKYTKPDPRVFNELLSDTHLDPKSIVYIGDSVGDAAAATGAGLHFIANLESQLRTPADFAAYSSTHFIHSFAELETKISLIV